MRRVLMAAMFGLGLWVPVSAAADGGPVPVLQEGAGVSAPGGDHSYVAVRAGRGETAILRVRRAGGAVEGSNVLPGDLGIAGAGYYDGAGTGLSADGRTLVLAEVVRSFPVRRTRLVVVDARRLRPRGEIVLRGEFGVDAISAAGRWLYLIHHRSPTDTTDYEVRAYDMRARRLLAQPIVDPREPDEKMQGVPMTRATSADGRWVYTLYQRPGKAPFIHALDTARRTAACIDLPLRADADLSHVRLGVGPRGDTLTVARSGTPVAVVDTRTFAVRAPGARKPPAAPAPGTRGDDGGSALPWLLVALAVAALGAPAALRIRRSGPARAPR